MLQPHEAKYRTVEAPSIRLKHAIHRPTCQVHHQSLVFRCVISDFLIRTEVECHLYAERPNQMLPSDREDFRRVLKLDLAPCLPKIKASTLLLWGEHDRVLDISAILCATSYQIGIICIRLLLQLQSLGQYVPVKLFYRPN